MSKKKSKIKWSLRTKILASLVVVVGAISALHSSQVRSYNKGQVRGCQLMVEKVLNPAVSPTCAIRKGRLVVIMNIPVLGKTIFDGESGQPVRE